MKTYLFACVVEADDELTKKQIYSLIDRDCNRGDGIYLCVSEIRGEQPTLRLVKHEKDE